MYISRKADPCPRTRVVVPDNTRIPHVTGQGVGMCRYHDDGIEGILTRHTSPPLPPPATERVPWIGRYYFISLVHCVFFYRNFLNSFCGFILGADRDLSCCLLLRSNLITTYYLSRDPLVFFFSFSFSSFLFFFHLQLHILPPPSSILCRTGN